ncbi:cache domain-containing protein [Roseivivax sediminis]|uniref:Cache domain-containing protein n=1 Tax=Roseivivax sediminis TaxID=936889 RepID=A0A1I1XNH2_9RHOB|nr:cache domain-containing protein [Roseivivax sediminis]SFE08902.1 hypothetical protein SAMN04515678_10673 [Roseivivax sediminis]
MTFKSALLGAVGAVCLAGGACAAEGNTAMMAYVKDQAAILAADSVVMSAMRASNARHADLTEDQILALDAAWRAEVGAAVTPTISPVLDDPASEIVRGAVANSQGRMTEVILMDNRGMNVAISGVTSDFWQGDEAKFLETFGAGPEAVHTGEVEFDESTQAYQVQVSVPVADETGALVGAVAVGLNIDAF